MKSIKMFLITLALTFGLYGVPMADAASLDCERCCNYCTDVFNDAVGAKPSRSSFVAWGTKTTTPLSLTCRVEALLNFGACCLWTNCLAPGNDFWVGTCVAGAMVVWGGCEEESMEDQERCQDGCSTDNPGECGGCNGC